MTEYSKVQKGSIIISEPYLGDDNFERTVVLICEHNETDGTVGFVLNRPTVITLDSVVSDIKNCPENLFIGGPVQQDSFHFIYRNQQPINDSVLLFDNLYWGGNYDELIAGINNKTLPMDDFRFFLGYSGWSEGQLKEEMEQGSWIAGKLSTDELYTTPPDGLWREVLKEMGGKYKMYSNYPIDPRLN